MKPIVEILPVVGASRRDLENWIGRLELTTKYDPSTPGRARLFSEANTSELALIAAYVAVGVAPRSAVALASADIREIRMRRFRIFTGGAATGVSAEHVTPESIEKLLADASGAHAVAIVDRRATLDRVAKLYAEDA